MYIPRIRVSRRGHLGLGQAVPGNPPTADTVTVETEADGFPGAADDAEAAVADLPPVCFLLVDVPLEPTLRFPGLFVASVLGGFVADGTADPPPVGFSLVDVSLEPPLGFSCDGTADPPPVGLLLGDFLLSTSSDLSRCVDVLAASLAFCFVTAVGLLLVAAVLRGFVAMCDAPADPPPVGLLLGDFPLAPPLGFSCCFSVAVVDVSAASLDLSCWFVAEVHALVADEVCSLAVTNGANVLALALD